MTTPRRLPTKAQWEFARVELGYWFGRLDLRVDGFNLQLRVQELKPLQLVIFPFVDGVHKGAWSSKVEGEYCEIARRFLPVHSKRVFNKKTRATIVKAVGKMEANKRGYLDTIELRRPWFTSFTQLKRHLLANNHNIEILYEKGAA